jgi:hypothetical protein
MAGGLNQDDRKAAAEKYRRDVELEKLRLF